MKSHIKRILWNITASSVVTLVIYFFFVFLTIPIMGFLEEEDQELKNRIYSFCCACIYPFVLVYFSKKKNAVGMEELRSDYKEEAYTSVKNDFRFVWMRERYYLIGVAGINLISTLFTYMDIMISGKPTVSSVFVIYSPLRIFASAFPFPDFAGEVIATLCVCAVYLFLVLRYRKKGYVALTVN